MNKVLHGNCLDEMRKMADNSVDSIVTDPPYGLKFMAKKWDHDVPSVEVWAECLRVLKPGGHLLAFAGTRTQHRMACRIEDAGFEIRDMIAWVYGSGFPKSQNVAKAISKVEGADADQWDGWGTALKPALEPITMARKPLAGTVAANVMAHGAGAINIDACRVPFASVSDEAESKGKNQHATFGNGARKNNILGDMGQNERGNYNPPGRWPANLIHDGSDEVLAHFPESSVTGKRSRKSKEAEVGGTNWLTTNHQSTEYTDQGSTARFFYCAKASSKERHEGLDNPGPQFQHGTTLRKVENTETRGNNHPTVKPVELMAYLCRLVTPPGGLILDPFAGSGSTGKAAAREGFDFIGIEIDAGYGEIANARIQYEVDKREAEYA